MTTSLASGPRRGNDIILNDRQCLTTPVMRDVPRRTVIAAVVAKARQLMTDIGSKGIVHVVCFHAYPLAAETCWSSGAPDSGEADLACHESPAAGLDCTSVDTRPELAWPSAA